MSFTLDERIMLNYDAFFCKYTKKWNFLVYNVILPFIVATNVIASRPPERRATETPHARANFCSTLPEK